jgi:membrane associated rhomboid family serine protease
VKLPSGQITNLIAMVTLAVFVVLTTGGLLDQASFMGGFIPARVDGMVAVNGVTPAWLPVLVTPLTATLVHASWLHVGFNLLMLLFCGRHVEHVLGRWPILILYMVGAYAAAGAQWAIDPNSGIPMVGASGAISALMGTYSLLYSRQDVRSWGPISANAIRVLWLAAGWIALQVLVGFATHVDNEGLGQIAVGAHVGGFVAGLLLTRPLLRWRFRPLIDRR